MDIRNVKHKGLKRFIEYDDARGLSAEAIPKIRAILAYLVSVETEEEFILVSKWHVHKLSGNRKNDYSFHVNRNWRLTFWVDSEVKEIVDLNLEDYH